MFMVCLLFGLVCGCAMQPPDARNRDRPHTFKPVRTHHKIRLIRQLERRLRCATGAAAKAPERTTPATRSEERRVGKECRERGGRSRESGGRRSDTIEKE